MSNQQPDHTTHVPVHVAIPTEDDVLVHRDPLPVPSLWQDGVQVTHRADAARVGVVRRVDHMTRQFRLVGAARTSWESFDNWIVTVEKSAAEKEKDAARERFVNELATLHADDNALVELLIDDPDPVRAMSKLTLMKKAGLIGASKKR